ncbi:MAG: 30S ribosomal protein S7 [Chloroflexota bacterium]|nr:30S ribosomal protein S7 [Chloroflexota bacterium]MDE2895486.1 30S ribosomal protein S7 [Chloroflexota bacterium]
MPRRRRPDRHEIRPDAVYGSQRLQMVINRLMRNGKKGRAEKIVYRALDVLEERVRQDPLEVFDQALNNIIPEMEVRPRRVGGATYQVPVEIRHDRRTSLGIRWLVTAAQSRKGRPAHLSLADELLDAYSSTGAAVRRREETHRMAEANRAFAHYRW